MTPARPVEHLLVMEKMDLHKVGSKDEDYKPGEALHWAVTVGSSGSFPVILQIEEEGQGLGSAVFTPAEHAGACSYAFRYAFCTHCTLMVPIEWVFERNVLLNPSA
ncbi:unnamed protein product [Leuciscus chuanchicus]